MLTEKGIETTEEKLAQVIELVKDRCTLLPDFVVQTSYFFTAPAEYDSAAVKPKWNADKAAFFEEFANTLNIDLSALELEAGFKALAESKGLKPGEVMLPLRIVLVGGKFGPGVFDIVKLLGKEETQNRIAKGIAEFNS